MHQSLCCLQLCGDLPLPVQLLTALGWSQRREKGVPVALHFVQRLPDSQQFLHVGSWLVLSVNIDHHGLLNIRHPASHNTLHSRRNLRGSLLQGTQEKGFGGENEDYRKVGLAGGDRERNQ